MYKNFNNYLKRFTSFFISLLIVSRAHSASPPNKDSYELLQRTANQGDANAQYNLGFHYATGDGVAQDSTKAVELFQKAADQGHADAQSILKRLYPQ